ncbi:MAG: cytochrome c peroxidase [FCB group bacterium]|jgi:cytochrome c peroxidase|nr:cytochrome c peroxidase [FCB group bacterium]
MKRLVLAVIILGILLIVAVPVTNLFTDLPNVPLAKAAEGDPVQQAALAVLSRKCGNCHSEDYKLPFYASLPVAKGLIEKDIRTGQEYMNYAKALNSDGGKPISETVLAKTEYTIQKGEMPPGRYVALHWNGALNAAEKKAVLDWIAQVRKQHYATGAAPEFANEPLQPLKPIEGINAQKAALGEKLYHDKRLSKDNSISCASCHDLAKGGTDQRQYSEGVGGVFGGINSPTTLNSGYQFIQFWDGRAADLMAQADGPVNNPVEMACNWEEAGAKLLQDAELTQAFLAVYPEGYKKETCTDAIAEYEKTLVTPNSRFDKYLMGDASALTEEERQGYELFKANGCATCHTGKIVGGQSFERMGRKADYFGQREAKMTDADLGRFNFTKDEADKHFFKTPTLRNIALTFPYFHDGSVSDLGQAVEMMAQYQVDASLSTADRDRIVAFLKTLNGELNGKPL